MALFDSTLLFWHNSGTYAFTSGEFATMVGLATSSASTVINLGNARDLGIGPGQEIPQVRMVVGTAFTSSSATLAVNVQFQGSTDSSHWTTYYETGASTTASWGAGTHYTFDVPSRPVSSASSSAQLVALPLYYQLNMVLSANAGTAGLSTGTVLAGIVLAAEESAGTLGQYPAGFSVS